MIRTTASNFITRSKEFSFGFHLCLIILFLTAIEHLTLLALQFLLPVRAMALNSFFETIIIDNN